MVTSTADSGPGTLRQAILDLDANGDSTGAPANTLTFQLAGTGPQTIAPATPLPNVTRPVFIDGWSQGGPGYSGPPLIVIDGKSIVDPQADGLRIAAGSSTVEGLAIVRFTDVQLLLLYAGNNLVEGRG
jgi:hypothetical protein